MNVLTAEQIKELTEAGFTKQQAAALKILVRTKEQTQEVVTKTELKAEVTPIKWMLGVGITLIVGIITILTTSINYRFEAIDTKFEAVNMRLETIEKATLQNQASIQRLIDIHLDQATNK